MNISIIFYRQYPRSEDRLRGHKRWLHQRPRDWNAKKEEEHRREVKQDELQSAEQKKVKKEAKCECRRKERQEKELRQREEAVEAGEIEGPVRK